MGSMWVEGAEPAWWVEIEFMVLDPPVLLLAIARLIAARDTP